MDLHTNIERLKKSIGHLCVLYVEDNDEIQQITSHFLSLIFLKVITARDGMQGISKFNEHEVDLIITDLRMPNLNGLNMIESIQNSKSRVPVIIISAYTETDDLLRAINLVNVDAFITKPVDMSKLIQAFFNVSNNFVENNYISITNNLTWNSEKRQLLYNKRIIKLTKNETSLIHLLVTKKTCIPPDLLENYIFDDLESNNKRLRNVVSRLNKKMNYKLVKSIYGLGYYI